MEWWKVLTLIAGAILGHVIWLGQLQQYADSAPPGWEREKSPVPYRESSLQGSEKPGYGEWGLDFYRAVYPKQSSETKSLSLTARIPKEGMLEVWYSSPPVRKRMGDRWMNICNFKQPQHRHGPQSKMPDATDPRCQGQSDFGVGVVLSRLSGQPYIRVVSEDETGRASLRCTNLNSTAEASETAQLRMTAQNGKLQIQVNQEIIECDVKASDRIPMLRSGLRQVLISELQLGNNTAPYLPRWFHWVWLIAGALVTRGIGWAESKHGAASRSIVGTTAPLLLGLLIGTWDAKVMIEDLRASWVSPYWLLPLIMITPVVFMKLIAAGWRESTAAKRGHTPLYTAIAILAVSNILFYDQGWIGMLACIGVQTLAWALCRHWRKVEISHLPAIFGSIGGLFMIGVNSFHWAGSLWATVAGVSVGLLLIANRFVVRGFNLWSILFITLIVTSGEIGLRATKAGLQWSNKGSNTEHNEIFGWVRQANESFALFEEGKHTQYPDKGFPVAISQSNHKTRIISFGGSTTGGAFQNDNLDEFYPALIDANLRNSSQPYEVLNQGVGGWTTWHIEQYIKQKSSALNPDVITLYVGHNDILTSVPMPYKELYPIWQQQSASSAAKTLSSLRLYQAFKYILVSLRGANNKVAVPIADARDNLLSIVSLYPETPIILGSEGLSPEPGILYPYNEMMQELAEEYDNVYYVDTAEVLSKFPPHEVFLDDCHLTKYGHQIVAKEFSDTIKEISAK